MSRNVKIENTTRVEIIPEIILPVISTPQYDTVEVTVNLQYRNMSTGTVPVFRRNFSTFQFKVVSSSKE